MVDINQSYISIFEMWHSKTSSIPTLFGEITITLDDVASLLHLPISNVEAHPYMKYIYENDKVIWEYKNEWYPLDLNEGLWLKYTPLNWVMCH
jgi:hypothetical protein